LSVDHLRRDRDSSRERQRSLREAIRERRPFDQLEHERRAAVRVLESEDRADVPVVERGEELRFTLEACAGDVDRADRVTGRAARRDRCGRTTERPHR
jgi:hypothetical protein